MVDLIPRLAQWLLDELASALRIVIVNGPRLRPLGPLLAVDTLIALAAAG